MIISRTPFRISFFGGGTDYPGWYESNKGAVLSTSIDKYCYITGRHLPPFFPHLHRIVYSRVETVGQIDEIEHPAVREVLRALGFREGLEIHHNSDLPARAGLGSSSSFVVGLLHALRALLGEHPAPMELAREAIHVEQNLLRENVGSQDQLAAAIGGLNRFHFGPGGELAHAPVELRPGRREALERHLMLFFTGFSRIASSVAAEQVSRMEDNARILRNMYGMVDEAVGILASDEDLRQFGALLHDAWQAKASLSSKIANDAIDAFYQRARAAGAIGGKLLGAGSGGFFVLFVAPEDQAAVRAALSDYLLVPFRFERGGTQLIFDGRGPEPRAV